MTLHTRELFAPSVQTGFISRMAEGDQTNAVKVLKRNCLEASGGDDVKVFSPLAVDTRRLLTGMRICCVQTPDPPHWKLVTGLSTLIWGCAHRTRFLDQTVPDNVKLRDLFHQLRLLLELMVDIAAADVLAFETVTGAIKLRGSDLKPGQDDTVAEAAVQAMVFALLHRNFAPTAKVYHHRAVRGAARTLQPCVSPDVQSRTDGWLKGINEPPLFR